MDIELTAGEEKTITFTYANSLNVSGATMSFAAKTDLDASAAAFTKVHSDFNMTGAATGVVAFDLTDVDTGTAGTYIGTITATFSGTSKDKTDYITIWIKESLA